MEMTVRRGRTGWQEEETARLFTAVKAANQTGTPLRTVFETLAGDLGRKPNSIRNYYYACLHQQGDAGLNRSAPFVLFTPEETHELLRQVLMARGRGMSVRSCGMQMAGGDRSRMLRYQNKYRTIQRTRPDMIAAVRMELKKEGLPCPGEEERPHHESADPAFLDPDDAAASRLMAQPCVSAMLEGIRELIHRAAQAEEMEDQQRVIDRMKVQHDLRRLAWERDYQAAAGCLNRLMTLVREFLALPAAEQAEALPAFRDESAAVLAEGEKIAKQP